MVVNATQHAGYFPGATPVIFKLLWSPEDGRVLGAQAVGKDGVDKRLDVIATAIRGRLTIDDLAHLELSYAPPFGSAKDVVNIAGFAAGNIRDGLLKPVNSLADAAGEQIIDVRPPQMAAKLPVPGAVNIPLGQLRGRLDEIDAHAARCSRSARSARPATSPRGSSPTTASTPARSSAGRSTR